MKKLFILFSLLALMTTATLSAQFSTRQAGLRMGYRGGLFYQISHETGNAETGYNALLSFSNGGMQITGLKIIYETSIDEISPNLFFAWGYGGHVGFIYSDHVNFMNEKYFFRGDRFCPVIGADGWAAAEYRISDIPLNVSLNIKPFVELTIPSFFRLMPGDIAI